MARTFLSDYLQVFPFWLADIGPLASASLPILTPIAGFATITAPEIVADVETFKEGNWMFARNVIKSGSVSPMTLTRGVSYFEADFYYWIKAALYGDTEQFESTVPGLNIGGPTYRRNLMLIHFFSRSVANPPKGGDRSQLAGDALRASLLTAGVGSADIAAGAGLGSVLFGLTALAGAAGVPFEFAARLPARAFILNGCIPKRYKSGSDFDASSGSISIAELDIEVETVEQLGLI